MEDENRMKVPYGKRPVSGPHSYGSGNGGTRGAQGRSSPARSTSLGRRWSASSARLPRKRRALALRPALRGTSGGATMTTPGGACTL